MSQYVIQLWRATDKNPTKTVTTSEKVFDTYYQGEKQGVQNYNMQLRSACL